MTRKRKRPDRGRATSKRFPCATAPSVRAAWTIGEDVPGEHCIDLTPFRTAEQLGDALKAAIAAPAGASVTLVIDPDQMPWRDAIAFLAAAGAHLGEIVIVAGDRPTATAWVWALEFQIKQLAGRGSRG